MGRRRSHTFLIADIDANMFAATAHWCVIDFPAPCTWLSEELKVNRKVQLHNVETGETLHVTVNFSCAAIKFA